MGLLSVSIASATELRVWRQWPDLWPGVARRDRAKQVRSSTTRVLTWMGLLPGGSAWRRLLQRRREAVCPRRQRQRSRPGWRLATGVQTARLHLQCGDVLRIGHAPVDDASRSRRPGGMPRPSSKLSSLCASAVGAAGAGKDLAGARQAVTIDDAPMATCLQSRRWSLDLPRCALG